MGDDGTNHELRQLEKQLAQIGLHLDALLLAVGRQEALLQEISENTSPVIIGATTGTLLFFKQGSDTHMDTFNPATIIDFIAEFDLPDGSKGRIDGPAVVADDNANDVVTVTDDGSVTGTCQGSIDGTKNVGADPKEVSHVTVTGDGNLGKGVTPVVLEGDITWDSDVVGATGGKVTFTARAATPPETQAFRAAVAKRNA